MMNVAAYKVIYFICFVWMFVISSQNLYADVCTPVTKPTKYIVKPGDHIASILRKYNLEPVFGVGGSLENTLKQNALQDQNMVEPGTEVVIPFTCEEQTNGWKLVDRGSDREITLDKVETKTQPLAKPLEKSTATDQINKKPDLLDPNKKTLDILNGDGPSVDDAKGLQNQNIESESEVSEALRYRMICEGEWTGTECITRYSTVYLIGGGWYNRYDGTDATTGATGTLLSKLNPELGFGWQNYWFSNFRTNLGFSVVNNEIHPEVRERPIEQNKKVVNSLFADMKYEIGPWGFTLGVEQTEKLFYRFYQQNIFLFNDGGVVVNAVPIFLYRGSVSYMFHQEGKYRFDAEFGLVSLQGTSTSGYNVSPGSGWNVSFTVQHDRVKEYIFGTLKYEESHQDTDILLQKAKELGFRFGYAWKLKDW